MVEQRIKAAILEIIATVAPDADLSDVKSDIALREQLDLDSMDFLDIVMELRKRHRVQVLEEKYTELASMASTVAFLTPLMKDLQKA